MRSTESLLVFPFFSGISRGPCNNWHYLGHVEHVDDDGYVMYGSPPSSACSSLHWLKRAWHGAVNNLRPNILEVVWKILDYCRLLTYICVAVACWTAPLPMTSNDCQGHFKIHARCQNVANKHSRIQQQYKTAMTNAMLSGSHHTGMTLVHAIVSSSFYIRTYRL